MFVSTLRKINQSKMIKYDKTNTRSNTVSLNINKNALYFLCKKRRIIIKRLILYNYTVLFDFYFRML